MENIYKVKFIKKLFSCFLIFTVIGAFAPFSSKAASVTYTVKAGDSLWKISQTTHISVNNIMEYNHMTSTLLKVGQVLSLTKEETPESTPASACYTSSKTNKYYINVSVANLWKLPGTKRDIDKYSLSNPVNMRTWTSKMSSTSSRLWLTGKTETEGLYGQEVTVLKNSGSWVEVAVKDQSTPKSKYGYPGWLPKSQIITQKVGYNKCQFTVVKSKTAYLYNDKLHKFIEISFNTRLPVLNVENDWVQVMTPGNQAKWLKRVDVNLYSSTSSIPKPKNSDLVNTAKMFLGLPYLWAGNSAYGFDCSGFTYTIYKYYGILLPRDATDQIHKGTFIYKSQLQPGDLLFFATNKGKGNIHHVSMYVGNGKMIQAPRAGKSIEIISINTSPYKEEYAGARRYLP